MSKEKRVAISVFSVAFAFGLNITGIMPVLSMVSEQYKHVGTSMIQMLQTFSYLLLMVGSLLVGYLTTKFTKKKLILFGLAVIGICGVLPFFSNRFGVLLAARILIGFGFGIVSPLNTAVIAELIDADHRAGYLGLHVVGMGLGAMFGNLLGGALAKAGLRYFYLVYAVAFVAMIIVQGALIETPPAKAEKSSGGVIRLNAFVYLISFLSFLHTLFINAYNTNISMYIAQNVTKDPGMAGVATAVNSVMALVCGAAFTKISKTFKRATLPLAIAAAALGYACVLLIPGMAGAVLASALCGISLSCFMAMASYLISVSVSAAAVTMASGIFSVIGGIGGLVAPMIMGSAATAIGGNTPVHQFEIALVGMAATAVLAVILVTRGAGEKDNGMF